MTRKIGFWLMVVIVLGGVFALPATVYADRCPYCGQEYGDPAPGDESRVYELRREHEASCPMRPGASSSGGGSASGSSSSYQSAWQIRQQEVWEEQMRIQAEQERIRQERLKRMKELAERQRLAREKKKAEFQREKEGLISDLKGGASGGLEFKSAFDAQPEAPLLTPEEARDLKDAVAEKTEPAAQPSQKLQEDYYKTLEIKKVPMPGIAVEAPDVKPEIAAPEEKGRKQEEDRFGTAWEKAKEGLEKGREKFKEWAKDFTVDKIIEHFPGASWAKDLKENYEKISKGVKGFVTDLFSHGVEKGAGEGIRHLANPNDNGRFASEYNEEIEKKAKESENKARGTAWDQIKKHFKVEPSSEE